MLLRVLFFEQKEVQYANTLVSLRRFKLPGILEIRLTTEPKKKKNESSAPAPHDARN